MRLSTPLLVTLGMAPVALGGPIAYGVCQTGCISFAVACYAAAGFTFGTVVAAAATPPAILACNAGLGACSAACTNAFFTPTP